MKEEKSECCGKCIQKRMSLRGKDLDSTCKDFSCPCHIPTSQPEVSECYGKMIQCEICRKPYCNNCFKYCPTYHTPTPQTEVSKCCGDCSCSIKDCNFKGECHDSMCPCHTPKNKIEGEPEKDLCRQCELAGNRGICDRKDCALYKTEPEKNKSSFYITAEETKGEIKFGLGKSQLHKPNVCSKCNGITTARDGHFDCTPISGVYKANVTGGQSKSEKEEPSPSTWSDEFDELFVRDDGLMNKYTIDKWGDEIFMAEGIKTFITRTLLDERERLIGFIESKKFLEVSTSPSKLLEKQRRNELLETIIEFLRK